MRAVLGLFAVTLAFAGYAQELVGAFGATRIEEPRGTSYGFLFSYSHDLGEHLSASVSYLNEGHFPAHHRDGHSAQLWLRGSAFAPNLVFSAGAGPYRYFDTTQAEEVPGFINAHGWGMQYSLAATWRSSASPWFYQLRADRIETRHGIPNSTQLLAAVGYRLQQDGSFRSNSITQALDRNNEVVLYGGETIVNSLESESTHSRAGSLEYRRSFGPVLHGVLAWLNEGDARLIRRNGVVAQAFLEPSFYRDRFTLGLGFGAYMAVDDFRTGETSPRVMTLVTSTMSYNFTDRWLARITWHRIVSNYDRDSDIILFGVGYRF